MDGSRDTTLLERICFNYEDDMIDVMVRFSKEVRIRRERYCRERRDLFEQQQRQMGNRTPAGRTAEHWFYEGAPTPSRYHESSHRPNIFNEQIQGAEGMSVFNETNGRRDETTVNRNDNAGVRCDIPQHNDTMHSIRRDNTPDISHPSNPPGNDSDPVPPSTPPPPFHRVAYGQGDRQACTPRATSSPQKNTNQGSEIKPPDASSFSNSHPQSTVQSLQQPHSHRSEREQHSDLTRVIQNPGVQVIPCAELSCPKCFYVFKVCAQKREDHSSGGLEASGGAGTCPTNTGQCSESTCPPNTNTSGGSNGQNSGTNPSGSSNPSSGNSRSHPGSANSSVPTDKNAGGNQKDNNADSSGSTLFQNKIKIPPINQTTKASGSSRHPGHQHHTTM